MSKLELKIKLNAHITTKHGRSVTEIWERDEMKNATFGGGDETKNLDRLGDETSNRVMYTQKA